MNYARVQKEVLAKLTKNPNAVVHCLTTDGRVCYVVDGQIGYIVPSDTNWIAVDKIMRERYSSPLCGCRAAPQTSY